MIGACLSHGLAISNSTKEGKHCSKRYAHKENRLVTTGAYALVRNPIYSAAMIACTGVILIVSNAWFFVLPFIYWLFMTVLMKATEEKWLRNLYGKKYDDYCKRVNRCWPWIPVKDRTE